MNYDFDTPIERHGTDSLKFDRALERHRSPDLLPLWVADMDFASPQPVLDALNKRVGHGIFGYTEPGASYFGAIVDWMEGHYGWHIKPQWVAVTPGVVYALAAAVRAFTEVGDAVLIQPPVYYPFSQVVNDNNRVLVEAPLVYKGGGYSINFEAFEDALEQDKVKLFLLCNPHNPVGRVWSEQELRQLGEICLRHNVVVVSDEIHMDFARPGFTHVPFAGISEELAGVSVACTSASKTFNLAGLQVANIVISNEALRKRFKEEVARSGYSQPNTLGLVATQAAYEQGGAWLAQLKDYLEGNWALLSAMLEAGAPMLHVVSAQSTYLAWIDCKSLGFDSHQLVRFIEDEAGLWLDGGHMFGREGEGFVRINLATQRSFLKQALTQICTAIVHL